MKKILITGAGGTIGSMVIKYLLAEGKYEITALDLKNKKSYKRLNKYRKRINIIYGDVLDKVLMEALIKDHDYIIHLASCLPPTSEYKENLANIIEYDAIDNITGIINNINPKCHLLYGSTTSLYKKEGYINSKIELEKNDYFNNAKLNSEKLIKKRLNNYTIFRIPLVLSNLKEDSFIYNINKNDIVEVITKEDAAYAFVNAINKDNIINKKIFNIGGGNSCRDYFGNILRNILKYYGFNSKLFLIRFFTFDTYKSPILLDSDESDKILNYRNDSLENYFKRLSIIGKKRRISKFLGKIILIFKYKNIS